MSAKIPVTKHRRALLARLHIAKKELGLSDEDYRAVLYSGYKKTSAAELTNSELAAVIGHFGKCGWKQVRNKTRGGDFRSASRRPMIRKIYVLWRILYINDKVRTQRPDRFVRRMTKTEKRPDGIANVEWLDDDQAHVLIEALKLWINRENLQQFLKP